MIIMAGWESYAMPRYLKIAMDLAARIASGEIPEGSRLKGRSTLATEYNVSPETIRRSVSLLSDKNVLKIMLGSGMVILSKENAIKFLKSFKDDERVADLRMKLAQLMEQRSRMDEEILTLTKQIIDMYRYKRSDLIKPVEIPLPENSPIIGKSIGELEIWHNTGATVIGVVQQKDIILSPGPYYEFCDSDRVLVVGDENVIQRFNAFVNGIS
jgi:K+/H+ antiporter YhaU regulatory subunit KhtT